MDDTRVLVDLAKEVLQVDELKGASPEVWEIDVLARELSLAEVADRSDYVLITQAAGIGETPTDAAAGTGTGNDEVHFREIEKRAVVQVDGELKRKKRADGGVLLEDLVDGLEGLGSGN